MRLRILRLRVRIPSGIVSHRITSIASNKVLWCNWLSLWTLNPAIRVQIPVEPAVSKIFCLPHRRCRDQQISRYSSVGRAGDCNVIVIPRSLVRIQLARYLYIVSRRSLARNHNITTVEWPSGLRRQVKALISSGARVRIPSQPRLSNFHVFCHMTHGPLSSEGRALAF